MSSFVLHALVPTPTEADPTAMSREETYHVPAAVARWVRPPMPFIAAGKIPQWANCLVIDLDGQAYPCLETPEEVAHLHAMASERMWHSFEIRGGEIWMKRYDTEVEGVECRAEPAAHVEWRTP